MRSPQVQRTVALVEQEFQKLPPIFVAGLLGAVTYCEDGICSATVKPIGNRLRSRSRPKSNAHGGCKGPISLFRLACSASPYTVLSLIRQFLDPIPFA